MAGTRVYQLYGANSQTAVAQAQILARGTIVAVRWAIAWDAVSDNSLLNAELSFNSNYQGVTNGAQGIIDAVACEISVITAVGTIISGINDLNTAMRIPVDVGQLIYLNTIFSGAATTKVLIYVLE